MAMSEIRRLVMLLVVIVAVSGCGSSNQEAVDDSLRVLRETMADVYPGVGYVAEGRHAGCDPLDSLRYSWTITISRDSVEKQVEEAAVAAYWSNHPSIDEVRTPAGFAVRSDMSASSLQFFVDPLRSEIVFYALAGGCTSNPAPERDVTIVPD